MPLFRRLTLLVFCSLLWLTSTAAATPDLRSLDSCITARPQCFNRVEQHIGRLKQQLRFTGNDHQQRLQLLKRLFDAYQYFQFDSALVYVKQWQSEAVAAHNTNEATKALLNKANLLATGGFYSSAEDIINQYRINALPKELRYDYAIASYWTYVYFSAFTMDAEFSTRMDSLRLQSLNEALRYTRRGTPNWYYLRGEQAYFLGEHPSKAIAYYKACISRLPGSGHLYSQATFAIARGYHQLHNEAEYAHYLLLSSKSDMLSAIKENAALQDLAMYIFHLDPDNATLAHHYLLVAMDDATFYNNKLRKLEISNQLHLSQKRLEHKNTQLNAVNNQLQTMNGELSRVNGLLVEANKKREKYLRLFVDICASTMDRINSYRNLVRLKIKAKQTEDLLRTVNSDRIVSRDMAQFYMQFDKAFLGLYPHFVDDFTKLLQPDYQVSLNKDGSLTTELRIFAFIRLGVTESSEIATLLSYSPHTIYNYRSAMKSHAIDKEHFEENVKNL